MSLLLDIHPLGHSLNSAQQIADGCGCDQFNCQRLLPTAPANGFLPTNSVLHGRLHEAEKETGKEKEPGREMEPPECPGVSLPRKKKS